MHHFHVVVQFYSIHSNPLKYTSFGKPNPSVFKNAEVVLKEVLHSCHSHQTVNYVIGEDHAFKTLYMIGDNPSVDIKGARQVGLWKFVCPSASSERTNQ